MTNKINTISYIIAGFLVILTASVYWNFFQNNNEFERNTELIKELQTLERQWSIAVLQTRFKLESDFDEASSYLYKVRDLKNKLINSELSTDIIPTNVSNQYFVFIKKLDAKEEVIERFKSGLAIIRNSIKYIPIASDIAIQQAKWNNDENLVTHVEDLSRDIQSYITFPTTELKNKIRSTIKTLSVEETGNSYLLSHAAVLIEKQKPTETLFRLIADNSVVTEGSMLLGLYQAFDKDRNKYQGNLFHVPYIACLLLFLLLIMVIRQKRSPNRISSTNNVVNEIAENLAKQNLTHFLEKKDQANDTAAISKLQSIDTQSDFFDPINGETTHPGSNEEPIQKLASKINQSWAQSVNTRVVPVLTDENTYNYTKNLDASLFINHLSIFSESISQLISDDDVVKIVKSPPINAPNSLSEKLTYSLVKNLQILRRQKRPEQRRFNFNDSVNDALQELKLAIDPNIKIRLDLEPVPEFSGIHNDILQLIKNLILNSIQELHSITDDRKKSIIIKTNQSGNTIILIVFDTGNGISKDRQHQLFSPSNTRFDHPKPLSLGLISVLKTTLEHNGELICRSIKNKGTAFQVKLPSSNS